MIGFIFNLSDPIGQTIVWLITFFFLIGLGDFLWHILHKQRKEHLYLKRAGNYFEQNSGSVELPDLLGQLDNLGIVKDSMVYRRIRAFVQVKERKGFIDQEALAEIQNEEEEKKGIVGTHILGILIVLGLIGTLSGLIKAIIEVRPLVTGLEDLDKLNEISKSLELTLGGMSTAFGTTLAGLSSSLLLGICGLIFKWQQSSILVEHEDFIATKVAPYFTQSSETMISSAAEQLIDMIGVLKFSTEENVTIMSQVIQQLTDSTWGTHLGQQHILAEKLGQTADRILSGFESISEYQDLIKSTVSSFNTLTKDIVSQIAEIQSQLQETLASSLPQLTEESEDLKTVIETYQRSQSEFINQLSDTMQRQAKSITDQQSQMVLVLSQLSDEVQIRATIEEQNHLFKTIREELDRSNANDETQDRILKRLSKNIQDFTDVLSDKLNRTNEQKTLNQISEGLGELNDIMRSSSLRRFFVGLRKKN